MNKKSCHDPSILKNIHKGVGKRLRMNSSKDEYFQDSVEEFSKAFAISGFDYQRSKHELNKFRNQDPVELIKSDKKKRISKPGCRVFYVSPFDPRVQHPRVSLSKHYHLLASNTSLANLFPRSNLVASCRRLPNLGEILSPTVQQSPATVTVPRVDGERHNGTYHCTFYQKTGRCDV